MVTTVFESADKDSNLMDRHSNSVGVTIGKRSHSLADLESKVRKQVSEGAELSDESVQITWLPKGRWRDAKFW